MPLGITDALPEGKQNTGGSGSAGPIVTAGGLVFVGATNDRRFRAFDSKTGKELWVAPLPGHGNANPMTYHGQERQAVRRDRRDGFAAGICATIGGFGDQAIQ